MVKLFHFLIPLMTACQSESTDQHLHLITPLTRESQPVTTDIMESRISEAAGEYYQQRMRVARTAFYDMAFPANALEFQEMNGNALLLITALSQQESELPLARVFFRSDDGDTELPLVTAVLTGNEGASEVVRRVFGSYRVDALYLLPLSRYAKGGDLLVDFARNRTDFGLARFPGGFPTRSAVFR